MLKLEMEVRKHDDMMKETREIIRKSDDDSNMFKVYCVTCM